MVCPIRNHRPADSFSLRFVVCAAWIRSCTYWIWLMANRRLAAQSVADAGIRVLAEEQVATAVGVSVNGVDDLHARVGVEVVAVADHAEDLLRCAVEINPGDHGNEVVELASGDRLCGDRKSVV